ncbi:MAG: hypothetical protein ACFFCP_15175 [Promethearchaeota archaeon]
MNEAPLELKTQRPSQIIIFAVVLVWSFMGFEIAQYRLVNLYETPVEWVSWATFLFISMLPVLIAITWRMKASISYTEPEWNFQQREITLPEYENMMNQYRASYQHLLSIINYPMICIAVILFSVALLIPFVLMRSTIYLIAATPTIFGFLVLLFGIVFANLVFRYIPNEATPHFSYSHPKQLRNLVDIMEHVPGISWAGVKITLGEAGGYFIVRDQIPVAHIEDIESVARIECQLSESSELIRVASFLQLEESKELLVVDESPSELSTYLTAQIVKKTLLSYIEVRGQEDLLAEVIEDVENYLKRFAPIS